MKPVTLLTNFLLSILLFTSIMSCSENSGCDDTMCFNGGVCVDGTCDCPPGFTGNNCQEQLIPDRIRIASVRLDRFPPTKPDGQLWDVDGAPDLFFRLMDLDRPIAQPMLLVEDADNDKQHYFFINIIDMYNVNHEHTMQLFDYEGLGLDKDFLGEIKFIPYHQESGLPSVLVLDDGGPIAFTIELEYIYKEILH